MFSRIERALSQLKGLFLANPTIPVSVARACRVSGLDETTCCTVLASLEHLRFVRRTSDGSFTLSREAALAESRDGE